MRRAPGCETCCACKHWQHFGDKFEDAEGSCLRHAPRPILVPFEPLLDTPPPGHIQTLGISPFADNTFYGARWPTTRSWDRCGEFERDGLEGQLLEDLAKEKV